MEQITAYEAYDGKLFKTEIQAKKHEHHQWHETTFAKVLKKYWIFECISADNLMTFLDNNEQLILGYFKSKKADK